MKVIGFTYDADCHCLDCTFKRFGTQMYKRGTVDSEGNEIHPMFDTDEVAPEGTYCGDCFDSINEPVPPAMRSVRMEFYRCDGCGVCFGGESQDIDEQIFCPYCGRLIFTELCIVGEMIDVTVYSSPYGVCDMCLSRVFYSGQDQVPTKPGRVLCAECKRKGVVVK